MGGAQVKFAVNLPMAGTEGHESSGGMALSMENIPQRRAPSHPHTVHHRNLPVEYEIDAPRRMVIVRFGKMVTFADIVRYSERLRADPSFQPRFAEIADLSEVEELDLQADEFLRLADEIDPFLADARRAFVARTSVQKHAARMHKILRTQRNIQIFDSVEKAKRWIRS
jgi:hypothetical protein